MKIPLLSKKSTSYQILDQSDREFILNNNNMKSSYRNNQINTSKYNFLTFLQRPVRSGGGIHVKDRGRLLRGLTLHQPGRESGGRVAQEL